MRVNSSLEALKCVCMVGDTQMQLGEDWRVALTCACDCNRSRTPSLSSNRITDSGASALMEMLQANWRVREL